MGSCNWQEYNSNICLLPTFFNYFSRRFGSVRSQHNCNVLVSDGLRSHGGENIVRKREARITKASIAITIMFVICHTPRVIPNVMEVALERDAFPKVINYN